MGFTLLGLAQQRRVKEDSDDRSALTLFLLDLDRSLARSRSRFVIYEILHLELHVDFEFRSWSRIRF